jgi:hypothetical protein
MKLSVVAKSPAESRPAKGEYTGLPSRAAIRAMFSSRMPRKANKPRTRRMG